jgi:deoxyribodipyrimidine photo-lyase
MKQYGTTLFIFRRDLRLNDNKGFLQATKISEKVIPCFILDPRQVGQSNRYKSANALQFMVESLQDLDSQLRKHKGHLYIVIKKVDLDAVFCNRDYTPFSRTRDTAISKVCDRNYIPFIVFADALLHEPEAVLKNDGTPYSIFTPFYKKALRIKVEEPHHYTGGNLYTQPIAHTQTLTWLYKKLVPTPNKRLVPHGGSSQAHGIIDSLKNFTAYGREKDYPSKNTTHLSAHLKFGTISIRHVYHALSTQLGRSHPLIRQLYWRDFFTHIAYHYPFVFGKAYRAKYDRVWWKHDKKIFSTWCTGTTGFPLIDAGMRELVATGFMHNRVRMVVASFLVKDLHIDWRWGERFFAQHLTDYDPAVNNGNWQWAASTGADAQPYFRTFNPWLQQKKFDRECVYIKKWVPELKNVAPGIIHTWHKRQASIKNYPHPIVDHAQEIALTKKHFKSL